MQDAAGAAGLDARQVVTALESGWKAGLAEPRGPEPANDPGHRPRYPYRDADGTVLYANVRVDLPDRTYTSEHQDGAGGWKPGRGGRAAVPYRLPDLIRTDPNATLYIVEGEKHADKLAGLGLLATSLKDWRREHASHVADRSVVI